MWFSGRRARGGDVRGHGRSVTARLPAVDASADPGVLVGPCRGSSPRGTAMHGSTRTADPLRRHDYLQPAHAAPTTPSRPEGVAGADGVITGPP
ncbi:hypothetical protein AEQ27_08755 [Frigoribacterium sp. RIT-PI-h]|nr:hypothetical protein AEQ27_08755 [Frigoribacterium sp. RIT-PI-h]